MAETETLTLDTIAALSRAVLEAAGADFSQVVKSTIFVKDMGQFARINEVYGNYFPADSAPARETVEVAALPKYVNVEISVIAHIPA